MDRKTHLPRLLVGGLIAGLIVNLGELAVNVWVLGSHWNIVLRGMGVTVDPAALVLWGIGSFVIGFVGVWIYAASSTRYGPGPRTALRAGLAVWAIAFLVPTVGFMGMGNIPRWLIGIGLLTGLIEVCLGTYIGSWLYREGELAEA